MVGGEFEPLPVAGLADDRPGRDEISAVRIGERTFEQADDRPFVVGGADEGTIAVGHEDDERSVVITEVERLEFAGHTEAGGRVGVTDGGVGNTVLAEHPTAVGAVGQGAEREGEDVAERHVPVLQHRLGDRGDDAVVFGHDGHREFGRQLERRDDVRQGTSTEARHPVGLELRPGTDGEHQLILIGPDRGVGAAEQIGDAILEPVVTVALGAGEPFGADTLEFDQRLVDLDAFGHGVVREGTASGLALHGGGDGGDEVR